MMKMNLETYMGIEKWIMQNGRQLEICLWKYFFKDGSQNDVLNILALYQNEDGGFGQALEPDNWNPHSTPSTTLFALNILKSIGYSDISNEIYQGIIKYLSSGNNMTEYGWMFSIPSNDDFPHAPWWGYNEEANIIESVGITAELSAFILRYVDSQSEVYQTAMTFARKLIDKMMTEDNHGDMGVSGYIALVDTIEELKLKDFDYDGMAKRISVLVTKGIEHDVSKWKYYGYRPSDYILSPESIYYAANKDMVDVELEYLIETKPEKNVWPITWTWFDNTEKYSKEFAVSEVRWKAIKAIEKMRFLKKFDRLCLLKE
ncbi:hypothetical protein [Anaerocolumna sp.]|uniref:hypothetical protein n=1 Tax=Anaerocolumna sp. TaxID=2041569 RepID=UPI0028AF862E|nr:hypothetical protein [Anaerocolumna sp.]